MSTENRTTAGLIGDLLATIPGERLTTKDLQARIQRDRTGLTDAVASLKTARALSVEADPEDRRRNVVFMTVEQAAAWSADAGASCAVATGRSLTVAPIARKAAIGSNAAALRRRAGLRFAVWNDGAVMIEGLSRKPVTLPAIATGELAGLFSAFPEGALQALCSSSLKPKFILQVEGRDHPLTPDETTQLIDYIEQLPARSIRTAGPAVFPGLKHGTDHRSHRIGGDGDQD